jgi:hypothetical protein
MTVQEIIEAFDRRRIGAQRVRRQAARVGKAGEPVFRERGESQG